ncbi:protein of unknown function (plasmid) [Cupriavidus taiwanensis]|nr:hypothetical protein CBM2622_B50205 [Cupriavidus taiwanensis]SPD56353.1 protein of unknown function [Cupriavidus taiwanensis]
MSKLFGNASTGAATVKESSMSKVMQATGQRSQSQRRRGLRATIGENTGARHARPRCLVPRTRAWCTDGVNATLGGAPTRSGSAARTVEALSCALLRGTVDPVSRRYVSFFAYHYGHKKAGCSGYDHATGRSR